MIVDRFSRWPVAVPLSDSRTQTILNAFIHSWLSHYGVPEKLTTDHGLQFFSQKLHTHNSLPSTEQRIGRKKYTNNKKAVKTLTQDKD